MKIVNVPDKATEKDLKSLLFDKNNQLQIYFRSIKIPRENPEKCLGYALIQLSSRIALDELIRFIAFSQPVMHGNYLVGSIKEKKFNA